MKGCYLTQDLNDLSAYNLLNVCFAGLQFLPGLGYNLSCQIGFFSFKTSNIWMNENNELM